MDLSWRKVPTLLILLIFWKHAVGQQGWSSYDVQPHQKWPIHKVPSHWGAQSSVLEAPVSGSIPLEEVASNVLSGKGLNASRSRFSLSHQSVKGGISSSYGSVSHTQSAPSTSVSASLSQHSSESNAPLLRLEGSFVPSIQDLASQSSVKKTFSPLSSQSDSSTGSSSSINEFMYTSQGNSGPQLPGSSSQLVSTHVSGLLLQSPSIANATRSSEYTEAATSPLGVSQSTSGQSSHSQYTSGSQSRVGTRLAVSSHVPTLGSSHGSFHTPGTTSQYAPAFYSASATLDAKLPVLSQAAPSGSSLSLSKPSQVKPSISRWSQGFQTSGTVPSQGVQTSGASQSIAQSPSRISSLATASTGGSSLQIQGTSSQSASATLDAKLPVSSHAAPSGSSLSLSQSSQLKPSISRWSQGFQTSVTGTSQSGSPSQGSKAPSRFSTLISAASPGQFSPTQDGRVKYSGLSSQSQSASSQYRPGSPVYAKHGSLLNPSSQSTSDQSAFGLYASSSHSRTALAGSSRYGPTQTGSTFTDGSSRQLQGTTSQYTPATLNAKLPVYSQAAPSGSSSSLSQPSQLKPSLSRWSQGFQTSGTVPSQGFQTSGASQSIAQSPSRISSLATASTGGSSLQIQGTTSQYAPATLNAKLPVYSHAAPSGSSLSSQLKPSISRWSQGFQTSGTVASQGFQKLATVSQSSSSSQGPKAPSGFSTLTSAASPGQPFSPPDESGKYSGLSSQSQSTSSQYRPGSPVYAKHGSSLLGPSTPSTSDRSTHGLYASSSHTRIGTQLAGSSHYVSTQTGSTFTDGSSLKLQGTSSQYAPATLDAKLPVLSQAAPSGSLSLSQPSQVKPSISRLSQGFQTSSTGALQGFQTSGASQSIAQSPSRISSLSSKSTDGSSLQIQGTSSQSASATLDAKLPVSSQSHPASLSGPSLYPSQSSQKWQPSTSRTKVFQASSTALSQGFQTSGASQSIAQSPSRISSLSSKSTDGSSLQIQGTSSQSTSATLDAKLPVLSQAAPSGSLSLSKPSQVKPSISRWSQGFQTSVTATSQSGSPSQGSKAPSRFPTLISATSPGQFSPTRDGSGKYSGLSSQSQSASHQYRPGSPVYAKHGSSLIDPSSQSTRDHSPSGLYASSSHTRIGTQLAGSSRYVPTQKGSTSSGGSFELEGTSGQYAPATLDAKLPVYSQAAPSGSSLSLSQPTQVKPSISRWSQGFQTSGASQSIAQSPSRISSLSSKSTDGSSLQLQGTSSQYAPATLDAKLPVYSHAAPSGSYLSLSQPTQVKPSISRLSQGFQTSSTGALQGFQTSGASQSISPFPSRISSLATASTDDSSLQIQSTASQSAPATLDAKLPVYSEAAPSGSSLSQKWQPSASSLSQWFQASGTSVSQSRSSPQTSQFPSGSSFMPALSSPVDSATQSRQSSISSSRTSSLSGAGLQPSEAASGSMMHKVFPGLFTSLQHPTDSMTASVGSNVQAASQSLFTGHSSDSTSVLSSRYASYGQKPSSHSRPSLSSSASRRYSSVKG